MPQKIKALLVFEQCNPEWPSFPLSAYELFRHISERVDVTLVTHIRNRENLEKVRKPHDKIHYIEEPRYLSKYWSAIQSITQGRGTNWPLLHALSYPVYADFNRKVYSQFADSVKKGEYDIVHACTPLIPRYPVKLSQECKKTPFIIGPVNGGLPYPKGFKSVAFHEFAHFNFIRILAPLIPGYKSTYRQANTVLVGNKETAKTVVRATGCDAENCRVFFDNGITENFLHDKAPLHNSKQKFNILFLGRLVAYKGPDILVKSLSLLSDKTKKRIQLTIAGKGPMRARLENLAKELNLTDQIHFAGGVLHSEASSYYRDADIFCSPSIRELGGTVIMEAFGHSLPCIVVNHGGPAEYITPGSGFGIEPKDKDYIATEIAKKIELLVSDMALYNSMSLAARKRAEIFLWKNKAKDLLEIYESALSSKKPG